MRCQHASKAEHFTQYTFHQLDSFWLSLSLSNIFLTGFAYNGVNEKIEATDKSIMESV